MFEYIEMVMTSQHINKTLNPTSWHSATSPPSLMVRLFFWRYICSYLAISMPQSIIRDRWFLFLPFILKGLHRITHSFLKGCKIFWRECEGLGPKIRVIALQFDSLLGPNSKPQYPSWWQPLTKSHVELENYSNVCQKTWSYQPWIWLDQEWWPTSNVTSDKDIRWKSCGDAIKTTCHTPYGKECGKFEEASLNHCG